MNDEWRFVLAFVTPILVLVPLGVLVAYALMRRP